MPLRLHRRGAVWHVRGRCDGLDGYLRRSLGTSDEAVAAARVREIERAARQRAVLGPDAPQPRDEITFAAVVTLYPARPAEARYLMAVVPALGPLRVRDITGQAVRDLAMRLYPAAAADTWQRQVVTPVRAAINHAAELGRCPPIRIRGFTRAERMRQDRARGVETRIARTPADWPWIEAFTAAAMARRRPYLAALAQFMFVTGARIGQAVAVTRVDLPAGRVWLPAAKGHPAQWVPIPPFLVARLANLPPRRGRVFGYASRNSVYGAWQRTCKAAGIEPIMPHAAGRHGFGTELLVRRGLDAATVARAGRWSSPRVLLDTYAHAGEDAARRVLDALAEGRSAASRAETRTNPAQPARAARLKIGK